MCPFRAFINESFSNGLIFKLKIRIVINMSFIVHTENLMDENRQSYHYILVVVDVGDDGDD